MIMRNRDKIKYGVLCAVLTRFFICHPAQALELLKTETSKIDLNTELMLSAISSEHTYAILYEEDKRVTWQEGYLKTGFIGSNTYKAGEFFAAVSLVASMTGGDGDAAGFTTGEENTTELEDLLLGWRNDFFEISAGRQSFTVGDGWLMNGDALNLGKGFDAVPGAPDFDRGGAYWLAARKSFENTAIISVGGESKWRSDLFYLESGNPAQAKMHLSGLNVEHVMENGTIAAMYLHGLSVSENEASFLGLQGRDGQKTYSIRYQGSAGIENLFLSSEYSKQSSGDTILSDTSAWYFEAGWQFSKNIWSLKPSLRIGEFDTGYDPLFYGFNRGYGTWFQGEVAANYAGPFNTDSKFTHISIQSKPSEKLTLGVNGFKFEGKSNSAINATEIDLYAEWWAHANIMISPLIGWYDPDASPEEGRIQLSADKNIYAQLTLLITF